MARGKKTQAEASAPEKAAPIAEETEVNFQDEATEAALEESEPSGKDSGPKKTDRRRRKRGDDVRERVLSAALHCFSAFGFEGTSTRDVASRADVTHTLVLYHFQSKEQLWYAAFEHALDPYMKALEPIFASTEERSAAETLGKFIETFVRQSALKPQIHSIMSNEGTTNSDRLYWIIDHFLRDHFKAVCDLIRRGQAEGSVRQCDPARLYYMIILSAGTLPTVATEYRELTGRNVASDAEILRNIAFIYEIVFV